MAISRGYPLENLLIRIEGGHGLEQSSVSDRERP